jgi:septal ring factor EnvC (AmiA/AmiB activator)
MTPHHRAETLTTMPANERDAAIIGMSLGDRATMLSPLLSNVTDDHQGRHKQQQEALDQRQKRLEEQERALKEAKQREAQLHVENQESREEVKLLSPQRKKLADENDDLRKQLETHTAEGKSRETKFKETVAEGDRIKKTLRLELNEAFPTQNTLETDCIHGNADFCCSVGKK